VLKTPNKGQRALDASGIASQHRCNERARGQANGMLSEGAEVPIKESGYRLAT
jgi:hypothetical protein